MTIALFGDDGPSMMSEGCFRFLCPHFGEMRATVNPRNNLAHSRPDLNYRDMDNGTATRIFPGDLLAWC